MLLARMRPYQDTCCVRIAESLGFVFDLTYKHDKYKEDLLISLGFGKKP